MARSRLESSGPEVGVFRQSSRRLLSLIHIKSEQLPGSPSVSSPTTQLRSQTSGIVDAVSVFPPANVAFFLMDTFLDAAQTNYTYMDEQALRKRLSNYYYGEAVLKTEDSPWICAALMVFAIATQFSHLKAGSELRGSPSITEMQSKDEAIALMFYHKATKLLPDVLAAADFESVQASLLLSVYTLPIDAAGLACTYVGIAIRIATQNGMHLRCHRSLRSRQLELRKRIWWSAYSLERQVFKVLSCTRSLISLAGDFACCMVGHLPLHVVMLRLIYRKTLQNCAAITASRHLPIS